MISNAERLDLLSESIEVLHLKVNSLMRAQGIELLMEMKQMADFTALNSRVSKLTTVTESIKTMAEGLKAERDALKAELAALKAADQLDQAAVDTAEASLATVNATLDALAAVASNTPEGGSMGGINA